MAPNPAANTDAPPKSRRSAGYRERVDEKYILDH